MRHSYIDEYCDCDSYLNRIDPRIKFIAALLIVFSVLFTDPGSFHCFGLYLALIGILIALSKIPLSYILKRSLIILPFVVAVAVCIPFLKKGQVGGGYSLGALRLNVSRDGLMIFWNVVIKSFLSVLALILLIAGTRFSDLLKGLEKMKFPKLLSMILSFMYRYIFVLADELMRMKRAKDSRGTARGRWHNAKTLANMLGILFIRAYEQGERVYLAMCSRGFRGTTETLNNFKLRKADLGYLLLIAASLFVIRYIG